MTIAIMPNKRPPWTMQGQLIIGKAGEEFIRAAHPEWKTVPEGERRYDLWTPTEDGAGKRTLEVKTDTYPHEDTPNFFMEARTTFRKGGSILGGPWRAAAHGIDEFVYLFSNGGTKTAPSAPIAYWFDDVQALVAQLIVLAKLGGKERLQRRSVRSLDVKALGMLVPRDMLSSLARKIVYRPEEP